MIIMHYLAEGDDSPSEIRPFVKRGSYFAGKTSDGKQIKVQWGSELGYPISDTVGYFPIAQIPDLIAALKAAMTLRE